MLRFNQLPGGTQRPFVSGLLVIFLIVAVLIAPADYVQAADVIYIAPGGAGSHNGADWANAKDLQAALANAISGDQLWVKMGTYKPIIGTDRTVGFQLKSGVAIYGGFAGTEAMLGQRDPTTNVTTLSGDLLGNDAGAVTIDNPTRSDNSYHVVTGADVTGTAVLDGFTITAGHANGTLPNDPNGVGGGMSLSNSSPTIAHVTFYANAAIGGGGMVNNEPSSPTLSYIIFCGNAASSGGGMMNFGGVPKITHAIFSGNRAILYGGGIFNYLSRPIISQATFVGNTAMLPNGGGGMWNGFIDSSPTIRNSIFWGNSGGQIVTSQGSPDVRYTLIQGGYISGTNILDAAPLFVDPNGTDNIIGTLDDNLHLQSGSPAIDAGDNASIPTDTIDADNDGDRSEPAPFDLDGRSRVVNGIVDMGVYEWSIVTSLSPPSPVTYGDTYSYTLLASDPSATFGVAAGELPPDLTLAPNGLLSGTLTTAGSYTATIIISGTFAVETQTIRIDVDKAPLTVRANDASRFIDAPNPPFSASYSGFVNGDTPAALGGTLSFGTATTVARPPGAYWIRPRGLSSANYAIAYVDGVLTVTPHRTYVPLLRR